MSVPDPVGWFAVVDERHARLLRLDVVVGDRPHVAEEARLETIWEDEHQHGRPAMLGRTPAGLGPGPGPGSGPRPSFASRGHEREEERRRFARDIHQWLDAEGRRRGLARITVFAAPRVFGDLRSLVDPATIAAGDAAAGDPGRGPAFRLRELELTRLHDDELARHPEIRAMLPAGG
jgi:protein required for attachment to host cells